MSQAPRGQCKGARPALRSRAGPRGRSRGRTAYALSQRAPPRRPRGQHGESGTAGHAWRESAPCRPRGRIPGDGRGPRAQRTPMGGSRRDAVFPTRTTPSTAGEGWARPGPESVRGSRANTLQSRRLWRDARLAWVSCHIYAIKTLFKSTECLKVKCWCEMTSLHQIARS